MQRPRTEQEKQLPQYELDERDRKAALPMTKIRPREQSAIDGLRFCLTHGRRPFRVDILILLHLVKRLLAPRKRTDRRSR